MKRAIVSYDLDAKGNWFLVLECGHTVHFAIPANFGPERPWILSAEGRSSHLGRGIDCPFCEQKEIREPTVVRVGEHAG